VDHRLHDGVHPLERAWLSQIRWRRVRHGTEPADRGSNVVWAVDFQLDATTDGRLIKIVSIVDEHTRECLGGLVDRNITSDDLIAELDASPSTGAIPAVLRCDNGPELFCAAMADWAANASACTSSHPASPGATATSSRSTAASATSA
jgi:hypothetical protein